MAFDELVSALAVAMLSPLVNELDSSIVASGKFELVRSLKLALFLP